MRHTGLFSISVVALMLVVSGCTSRGSSLARPTPWPTPVVSEKPQYTVQRGTVVDRFKLTGQVVPTVWEAPFLTVDGRLAAIKVIEGTKVKEGDILAELEMKTLLDQLAQAQLSLEQAEDQLKQQEVNRTIPLERARLNLKLEELALERIRQTDATNRPLQELTAEKELERAKLNLEKAQGAYDAVAWRSDIGSLPQAAALQTATYDYQIAEARYKLQTQGDIQSQIAAQEVKVKLAKLAVQEIEERTDPNLERNVTKAKMTIDALERQIEERRLRAPFDGEVIAVGIKVQGPENVKLPTTRPKEGDNIPAFTPLVVVAKPDETLEIVARRDQERAGEIAVGQTVSVTHHLAPNEPFSSTVAALPVSTLGSGAQALQPQVIRFNIPPNAPKMAVGDYVEVVVVAATHQDTLFLPPAAVRRFGGRTFVVAQGEGVQRRVDVAVGLENQGQVEILSGLKEGDVVVGQ